MNLIRKYKLSKVLNQPLTGIELEIIKFIESKISNLIEFKLDNYPDSIFYLDDAGKLILEFIELENGNYGLYVRYNNFWEILDIKYSMEYSDTQSIIQYLVENSFKSKIETTTHLN